MDPGTRIIAGKFTGKLTVAVAIGRMSYIERFEPFGQVEAEGEVYCKQGVWYVKTDGVMVPYGHDSPRIITHVGVFVYDCWLFDPLSGKGKLMFAGDFANVSAYHALPEHL